MTVIVAAKTQSGGVTMACDSQVTTGWQKEQHDEAKIWTTEQFVVGSAGCVRVAQVIRHYTDWPKFSNAEDASDVERWLVKKLVPAIRSALKDSGTIEKEDGVESWNASLLVAWGSKHLARVSCNGAVIVDPRRRMAVGSGYAEALGYLSGISGKLERYDVVQAARIAAENAVGCGGPFYYATTYGLEVDHVR